MKLQSGAQGSAMNSVYREIAAEFSAKFLVGVAWLQYWFGDGDGRLFGRGAATSCEKECRATGQSRGGERTQVCAHLLQDLHILRPLRPLSMVSDVPRRLQKAARKLGARSKKFTACVCVTYRGVTGPQGYQCKRE